MQREREKKQNSRLRRASLCSSAIDPEALLSLGLFPPHAQSSSSSSQSSCSSSPLCPCELISSSSSEYRSTTSTGATSWNATAPMPKGSTPAAPSFPATSSGGGAVPTPSDDKSTARVGSTRIRRCVMPYSAARPSKTRPPTPIPRTQRDTRCRACKRRRRLVAVLRLFFETV